MLILRHVRRTPAGGQNNRTEHLSVWVELGVCLQTGIGIFHLTLVYQVLIFNGNLSRGIPLRFGTCFLVRDIKLAGSTTDTGYFSIGFNGDFGIRGHIGNHLLNVGLLQACIGIGGGKHLAPAKGFTAKLTSFLNQGYFVAGPGSLFSCCQAGNTATHNQDLLIDRL